MNKIRCITRPLMWLVAILMTTLVTGCGGGGTALLGNVNVANSTKAIAAFSFVGFPANAGVINEPAKTIAVNLPFGTNPAALVATFITTGTAVTVTTTTQVSGTTPNNFAAPVIYTVTALDGTTAGYIVTVTILPSTLKSITAFSFIGFPGNVGVINEPAKTIAVNLPFGTNPAALIAAYTSTGISVNVAATPQVSGITPNNFTAPLVYTVTAGDTTTANYTVTVTFSLNSAKAMTTYSFLGFPANPGVVNEPAKTIAVTVPFGTNLAAMVATFTTTGANVTVGATLQTSTATVNNFTAPVVYTVTAADASTVNYTVTVTAALNPAKAMTAYSFVGFPANPGVVNEPAKTIAVTVPFGTNVTALAATFTTTGVNAKIGATVQTSTSTLNNFTAPVVYTVTAADASTVNYTVTVTAAPNPAKAMTAYSFVGFPANPGVVNEPAKTIAVTVPFGTNVTALAATFTTTGANVKVGAVVQTSTATANNFTTPVIYTVTAADATTVNYTVTVTAALNPAKAMTAYSFVGFPANPGVVNEPAKTIAVTVPFGTNVTALAATFTTTGVNVKVGAVVQTSTATANDFTAPVVYTVTAADASTVNYTVTVTAALNPAKAMTAYSFVGFPANPGVINEPAKTIAVTVPFGTNVTALAATFTTTGANVKVGAVVQTSTATANNFTAPVVYTVTAADATTVNYTVTVTAALNPAKAMTAYSFSGFPANPGVVNELAKTIAVTVPFGTNVSALVATFTTTGVSAAVGATVQTSTATANNFTLPVVYTVTAADATTVNYTVTVTVALNPAKAITAFSIAGFTNSNGVINELVNPKTIAVGVPPGTNLATLVAVYTSTGVSESVVATGIQTSGATSNNFTVAPVPYLVTAADLSTATYNVTVTTGAGPVPVLLGTAGNFAILSQAGITDVPAPTSMITGNVGTSPITGAALTGTGWCTPSVVGLVYVVDAAGPAPCATINAPLLTTAIGDMGIAYTDAFTRPAGAGAFLNPGAGLLGVGTVLPPGLYSFTGASVNVSIATNLTLTGGPNDVWIFQIPGTLVTSPAVLVTLAGGAVAKNVFWQVAGAVTLGTTSHFEGVILAATNVAMNTGASINGRVLAQTTVTLGSNTVTQPAP